MLEDPFLFCAVRLKVYSKPATRPGTTTEVTLVAVTVTGTLTDSEAFKSSLDL